MNSGRKMITADHVNGLRLEENANVLSAMATDGPCNVGGRGVQVFMTDEALRGLLAHLAMDARWSSAFDAVLKDREARQAEAAQGSRVLPEQLRSRARLIEAMRAFMTIRDTILRGDLDQVPSDRSERSPAHRLNLPATAPLEDGDQYAALVAYGGAIVHAEAGCVTELVRPDGRVAARIVPA